MRADGVTHYQMWIMLFAEKNTSMKRPGKISFKNRIINSLAFGNFLFIYCKLNDWKYVQRHSITAGWYTKRIQWL